MAPQTDADPVPWQSPDPVIEWRVERLLEAGYSREAAILIARDTEIDLHVAVELLERGCPMDAALQILF